MDCLWYKTVVIINEKRLLNKLIKNIVKYAHIKFIYRNDILRLSKK